MSDLIDVAIDADGIAVLRLDRPPANALDRASWSRFGEVARELEADPHVRAVVIWGGPRVFAAGADIADLATLDGRAYRVAGRVLQESFTALAQLTKPTVAAINGYALGGGCELALTADFRIAASDAKLGLPEVKLGIIPGAGGTQRLSRLIGLGRAKDLVMTGRHVDAEEALRIGLVHRVVPPEETFSTAHAWAVELSTASYAVRMAKRALDGGLDMGLDAALRWETELISACFDSDDARIGLASFMEKGPGRAEFTGR
jgi:enoyl-CoA hydratase/carnithine racemase